MKKIMNKIIFISSFMSLSPMIICIFIYNKLPYKLPIHFDLNGNITNYSNKFIVCILLPIVLCILNIVLISVTKHDPKKYNHNKKIKSILPFIIPLLSIIMTSLSIFIGLGKDINAVTIIISCISFLFLIIGNYLPKIKQNYTIGIRTPWTLNDKDNWHKTHRFSSKVWSIFGIINIIIALIYTQISPYLFISSLIFACISPILYSFIYYKKHKNT